MVGLADLKRYTDNIKRCHMTVNSRYCFFQLTGLNIYDFLEILNYKSWILKTYQKSVTVRYVNVIKKLEKGNATVRTSVGFGPLLLRFLRSKGFQIREEDVEAFRARTVVFPDLKLGLYDFQNRIVDDWLRIGGIGVTKSPTGSGKTIYSCRIIKEIGRKTLILVHTSDLLINVWNDSLIKAFGPGIMGQVGVVGGGLTDSDRMAMKIGVRSGDFHENMRSDIVIATFQTFVNRIDEISNYKFGLMIVDECIPVDSNIWTKDGIIKYENLSWDNGIYQVWSGDGNRSVANNGYKKIKTIFKHMYKTVVETGDELVCSLDHKILNKKNNGNIDISEIGKTKNVARSLIMPYDMRKECILARSFGYILGDGWVDINRDGGAGGDYDGLSRLQYDLKRLNYYSNIGKERELESTIDSISSGLLVVHGTVHNIKFEKRFSELLIKLGHPIGRKTNRVYYIPDWIMNGDIDIKREFVAGYLGAEGTNPGFRGDENNKLKRSFFVPRFSITKRIDLIDKGLEFAGQFKKLLKDLDVEVSDINVIEGNIRKDGTISKKIVITISNQFDNLRRYLDIGYRYCHEKEKEGETIRLFLKYIDECNKERDNIHEQVIKLYDKGMKKDRIITLINNRTSEQKDIMSSWGAEEEDNKIIIKKCLVTITDGMISDILHLHKRDDGTDIIANTVKIKKDMYNFDDWKNKVVGDFIFLDTLMHEYRGYEQGYTLTVDKDHNYLVNGFCMSNCHHVPAKMFRKVNAAVRAPYKLGLSATLKRLDGLEKDVFSSLGDVQSSVTIRELINKGILAEPRFQSPIIVDKDIIEDIETCGYGGLNLSRYVKKMSASSTKKKDYIINICRNIAARDRKFLLFTDYVHAEDVYVRDLYTEALLREGVRVSIIDQEMNSDERSTVFKFLDTGEISGIVFGKLGSEGVNIPSVDAVIMANGLKCISGDTLVPTNRGMIRAKDLDKINPEKISIIDIENNIFVRGDIKEFFSFEKDNSIIIRTEKGYEIEGSFSHMILVKDNKDNIVYRQLSDITIGDRVLICGSNIYGENINFNFDYINPKKRLPTSNIGKYISGLVERIKVSNSVDKDTKKRYIKIDSEELKKVLNTEDISSELKRIKHNFYYYGLSLPILKYDKKNKYWYYKVIDYTVEEKIRDKAGIVNADIFIPDKIDSELAELLGYIVSEGYVNTKIKDWRVVVVNKDETIIDRVIYLFKSIFDYDVSIYKDKKGCINLSCTRKNIVLFLAGIGLEHLAEGKFVPDCIFRSKKDIQVAFLRSLFAGDGNFSKGVIKYDSTSKRLLKDVQMMLLNMGIISKYNRREGCILIYSRSAEKFLNDIGFGDDREYREYIYDNWSDHRNIDIFYQDNENLAFFDSVVSKSNNRCKLYDMNIDKYHSFIAGGFVNHNSPITFCQRVGRAMRRVPGKQWCDVYEILLDTPMELRWSDFNFAEYKMEGFQKLVYKVE